MGLWLWQTGWREAAAWRESGGANRQDGEISQGSIGEGDVKEK